MLNKQPSKEYTKNINYYKKMHLEGYTLIDGRKRKPNDAYDGKSTLIYAKLIKDHGCEGVEIAPSCIWEEPINASKKEILEFNKNIKKIASNDSKKFILSPVQKIEKK